MKGRFRKGKKAAKKAEQLSARQLGLKIRYLAFTFKREIEKRIEILYSKMAVEGMTAAFQVATINSQPRPAEMTQEQFRTQKAVQIMDITINRVEALQGISSEIEALNSQGREFINKIYKEHGRDYKIEP